MEYRNFGDAYYIRMDRGDEMVAAILDVCNQEGIESATYSGIGGCESADIAVFNAQRGEFDIERVEGLLELVSFTGNVIADDEGVLHHHTHALFAYVEDGEHRSIGGHLKATVVRYTAEIELRPVMGGRIGLAHDPETGTGFWKFG